MWLVEVTDEYIGWTKTLTDGELDSVLRDIRFLVDEGSKLGRPQADAIRGSRHRNMKELRTQHAGRPLRSLFAFDPRRAAILLIGDDKTGDDHFYDRIIPLADRLYDDHLAELRKAGLI